MEVENSFKRKNGNGGEYEIVIMDYAVRIEVDEDGDQCWDQVTLPRDIAIEFAEMLLKDNEERKKL